MKELGSHEQNKQCIKTNLVWLTPTWCWIIHTHPPRTQLHGIIGPILCFESLGCVGLVLRGCLGAMSSHPWDWSPQWLNVCTGSLAAWFYWLLVFPMGTGTRYRYLCDAQPLTSCHGIFRLLGCCLLDTELLTNVTVGYVWSCWYVFSVPPLWLWICMSTWGGLSTYSTCNYH